MPKSMVSMSAGNCCRRAFRPCAMRFPCGMLTGLSSCRPSAISGEEHAYSSRWLSVCVKTARDLPMVRNYVTKVLSQLVVVALAIVV